MNMEFVTPLLFILLMLWKKLCGGLNMLVPGSGNIRRYGLVAAGVVLLEEVCYCRGGL